MDQRDQELEVGRERGVADRKCRQVDEHGWKAEQIKI